MLSRRFLVVANRTAATPDLLDAIAAYAREQFTEFSLLIPDSPDADHADWTLELALPLLQRAARGPVEGIAAGTVDPFDAVRDELAAGRYDRVVISTLPRRVSRWLRRDLPRRVEELGVPVDVITPGRGSVLDEVLSGGEASGMPPLGVGG